MKIKIFALTHKKFEVPQDKMYQPLQVGREEKEDLGYLCDNTGDNISAENCYYSELTGLYWIWKNVHTYKYVGTCHYRRYLLNEQEKIFTEAEYLELLKDYDLITTKRVVLNNSYHYGFATNHNIHALDMTGEVIKELYPEYYDTFVQLVNGTETYFAEMLKKRPDVLMEASDITGELKLSMQIIATMDQESQRMGHCYLRKENRFRELITLFTRLNA